MESYLRQKPFDGSGDSCDYMTQKLLCETQLVISNLKAENASLRAENSRLRSLYAELLQRLYAPRPLFSSHEGDEFRSAVEPVQEREPTLDSRHRHSYDSQNQKRPSVGDVSPGTCSFWVDLEPSKKQKRSFDEKERNEKKKMWFLQRSQERQKRIKIASQRRIRIAKEQREAALRLLNGDVTPTDAVQVFMKPTVMAFSPRTVARETKMRFDKTEHAKMKRQMLLQEVEKAVNRVVATLASEAHRRRALRLPPRYW